MVKAKQVKARDALAEAIAVAIAFSGAEPGVEWTNQDDGCDCTFQRVGYWGNPYLAETLEVRMCCIWERIYAQYPEFVRRTPSFTDPNTREVRTEPVPWDSREGDMPRAIWYRQLARTEGRPLAEIRADYAEQEPPQAVEAR